MNPTYIPPQPPNLTPDWVANVKPTSAENEKQMTSSTTSLSDTKGYVAPKPSLISTSGQSQNLYNENVNKMNTNSTALQINNNKTTPDSSTSTEDKNNTVKTTGNDDQNFLTQKYNESIKYLDESAATAKTNLEQARLTLSNDPEADAAVSAVMAKYDEQIRVMKAKNELVKGNNNKNSARYGTMQYATEMNENFLSDQQDRSQQRVVDLITEQTNQALKVRQAYKSGNLAEFNAAQKAFDNANKAKIDAINDLLEESHKVVKEQQAELKLKQTEQRNNLTDDIKLSANLGKTIADSISGANITDPKKRKQYIAEVAEKYGIENVDLLDNSVVKAEQEATRQGLLNKSTLKSINKTPAPKKAPAPKAISFNAKEKTELTGYGNTGTDVTNLSQDIYKYGIDKVIANPSLDENTKQFLKDKYDKN